MADGDEKIDHNDRVLVLNRVIDAPTEAMYDGKVMVWGPGEVKSIQRLQAPHYITKSTILWDPTNMEAPVQRLVLVDEREQPLDPDLTAEPLTAAECKELAKFGVIDTRNLPAERMVGGKFLMDEDGNTPTRREVRGAPKDGPAVPPNL